MSEIKALEKLREMSVPDRKGIEVFMKAVADEIQAEVDERFMELPLDADGVPIRVGDMVEWIYKNGDYEVIAVGNIVALRTGEYGTFTVAADALRHVKPRTLEDVLEDCCDEWNQHCGNEWESGVYAKYAAEIRELLGVSA